ncbi:MAG: TVP38/TMEM64 family protein, partial [Planctomycetaceae bacterium]|nr:TVP38/TMEM64 family protein [Planctomycetaceae bacterium]
MAIVSRSTGKKLALFAAFIIAFLTIYFQFGELLSLKSLAAREAELRSYQQRQPVLVFGVAFLVYVAVTGLSIPGASAMTIVCGWFLGFWRALLLVSFASTAGATVAFLVSRYLLRDTIQDRFGERLSTFHDRLEREGAFYLFLLRLVPAVPFFVINAVMGLTPLPARTFWWVSQLGMLPGTVVYVYAGAS